MNIRLRVKNLTERHHTRDPIRIAKSLGILVKYDDIGETKGFFTICNRTKVIVINSSLDEFAQLVVAAHELGHALMHSSSKQGFWGEKLIIQDYTLFPTTSIYENQANKFAAELLIHEDHYFYGLDFGSIDKTTYDTLLHLKDI